jgi:hypothetical protein
MQYQTTIRSENNGITTGDTEMAQQSILNSERMFFLPQNFAGSAQDMIDTATRLQSKSFKTSFEMQKEAFDFLQNRYRKEMALASNLMTIRHPADAMSAYAGFIQDTLDDYANEAVKLGNYGAEILSVGSEEGSEIVEEFKDAVIEAAPAKNAAKAPKAAAAIQEDIPAENVSEGLLEEEYK